MCFPKSAKNNDVNPPLLSQAKSKVFLRRKSHQATPLICNSDMPIQQNVTKRSVYRSP